MNILSLNKDIKYEEIAVVLSVLVVAIGTKAVIDDFKDHYDLHMNTRVFKSLTVFALIYLNTKKFYLSFVFAILYNILVYIILKLDNMNIKTPNKKENKNVNDVVNVKINNVSYTCSKNI